MEQRKFSTTAGPRQTKTVVKAIRELTWNGKGFWELSGVKGGEERRSWLVSMFGPESDDCMKRLNEIGDKYAWTITAKNYMAMAAEFIAAAAATKEAAPIRDERQTPEENAELNRKSAEFGAKQKAKEDERATAWAAILAKKPTGAAHIAAILAIHDIDKSEPQADYSGHISDKCLVIGWRYGEKEDFKQLRAAAAKHPETEHLGPAADKTVEHRDNYSMGAGNYLKKDWIHSDGWRVVSWSDLNRVPYYGTPEDRL